MPARATARVHRGTTVVCVSTTVQLVLTCSVCVHHSPVPLTDSRAVILRDIRLPVPSVYGQYAGVNWTAERRSHLLVESLESEHVYPVHDGPTDGAAIVRCCRCSACF